jgi:hypothetical protein
MSQDYESWDVDARPAFRWLALFVAALLFLVVGTGLIYNRLYAAQTRPDPKAFPAPALETIDSAPGDRTSVAAPQPPAGIDRAMADVANQGDALWNG